MGRILNTWTRKCTHSAKINVADSAYAVHVLNNGRTTVTENILEVGKIKGCDMNVIKVPHLSTKNMKTPDE
jgi:hypothetical protein